MINVAERKGLGLLGKLKGEEKAGASPKVIKKINVNQSIDADYQQRKLRFTIDEVKELIKSLGGDPKFIDNIEAREKELRRQIDQYREEINRLEDEIDKIRRLKALIGLA